MSTALKIKSVQSTKTILSELKKVFDMRKAARFWFGTMLSLSQQISLPNLKVDCNQHQIELLFAMLSYTIADIISFYQKQIPEEVYHLLQIIQFIFTKVQEGQTENCQQNYRLTMQKLHYYNLLGVFMMKNKQYLISKNCFEQIVKKYFDGSVETASEIFLTAFNNYLFLLKTVPSINKQKDTSDERMKILQALEKIILELLARYLTRENPQQQSIRLLLSVYNQHELFFTEQTKSLCLKLFQQSQKHDKQKKNKSLVSPHQFNSLQDKDPFKIDRILMKKYLAQNSKNKIASLKIKKKQLGFFVSFSKSLNKKQKGRLRAAKQSRTLRGVQLQPISRQMFMDDYLQKPASPRKQQYDRDESLISKQLYNSSIATINLKPNVQFRNRPFFSQEHKKIEEPQKQKQKQDQNKNEEIEIYKDFISGLKKCIILKNSFILLKFVSEGMVLENYLAEKQKFLTWQDLSILFRNFRSSKIFQQMLPFGIHYQISNIFIRYLYKNQSHSENKKSIMLSQSPHELVYLNQLIKVYKQEGPFLKLEVMNLYDSKHLEFACDCYIDDFDHYFKKVKSNQYIQWLNKLLFCNRQLDINIVNQQEFSTQLYRKNKGVSREQIENQLRVEQLRDIQSINSKQFLVLLVMKNNKRLLLSFDDNTTIQESQTKKISVPNISIKIVDLNSNDSKPNFLMIPIHKFLQYFPINISLGNQLKSQIKSIISEHAKIFIEPYLHCFDGYPQSFYMKQNMIRKTYVKKIQMIKQGKYYVPISVEIVGTEKRVLGIIFKQYQQAQIKEVLTFIYNQSYEFLNNIIDKKLSEQQKFNYLKRILVNGSVKESLEMIKKQKLRGSMVGIFQYLNFLPNEQSIKKQN